MFINLIKRLFLKPEWKLAIREIVGDEASVKFEGQHEYSVFEPGDKYWCADPFLCEYNDNIYIFCECYVKEKNKGVIAVAEYKDGKICNLKTVIEQKYHMSYPCIFKHNNYFYIIPETCGNNSIELYKALKFPDIWVLDTVLKNNIKCVDATVLWKDEQFYVLGYDNKGSFSKLVIFELNMDNKTLKPYAKMNASYTERPAGNLFNINNKLIRPSQDGRKKYGGQILINEVALFEKDNYCEKLIAVFKCENVKFKEKYKADRIHTVNRVRGVEVIDFSQDKFDLLRGIKIIKSRVMMK